MTPFDYLALAISVILGLAITRLISGIGISIRQIKSKKYFWLHGLWVLNMLILLPAYWWGLYSWSSLEVWNFFHFLLLIIYTTNLYLITDFLVPEKFDSGLNIKEYFMENKKLFFGLVFLSLIIDIAETYIIVKAGLRDLPRGFPLIAIILSILVLISFFTSKLRMNYILGIIWGLVLSVYIVFGIFFI